MNTKLLAISNKVKATNRCILLSIEEVFTEDFSILPALLLLERRFVRLEAKRGQMCINMLIQSFTHRHYQIILVCRLSIVILTSSDVALYTHAQ